MTGELPTKCGEGTFNNLMTQFDAGACQTCPQGFAHRADREECDICVAGFYGSEVPRTSCASCEAGYYLTAENECSAFTSCTLDSTYETTAPATTTQNLSLIRI